ncbi:hypothetical protein ACOME3_005163 [Neoechinorhynchus agilis]
MLQKLLRPSYLCFMSLSNRIRNFASDINPDNVAIFRKQWNKWDDPMGTYKALHAMNPFRVKWITSTLERGRLEKEKIKLLDIGCGGGLLSNALSNLGYNVTAIDPV